MKTAQHWDRLAKNQPAEMTIFQILAVQKSPAFNGRLSFLTLRAWYHVLGSLSSEAYFLAGCQAGLETGSLAAVARRQASSLERNVLTCPGKAAAMSFVSPGSSCRGCDGEIRRTLSRVKRGTLSSSEFFDPTGLGYRQRAMETAPTGTGDFSITFA